MLYLFLISLLFSFPRQALAVSITPTPTISVTDTVTPTNTDQIQRIREVVQQKVQEKLKQIISPSSVKKGIVGKVIQVGSTSVTIEYQNSTKTISLASDTVFIDIKRNKTKLENMKIGQDILVMGTNNTDNNTFDAKRIVFIDLKTIITKRTVVVGKIVDISKTSPVFTLIPSKNKNGLFQIKTNNLTELNNKQDKTLKITDLKSGYKIIAVLIPDAKVSNTYNAIKIINLTDLTLSPTPTISTATASPTKKP